MKHRSHARGADVRLSSIVNDAIAGTTLVPVHQLGARRVPRGTARWSVNTRELVTALALLAVAFFVNQWRQVASSEKLLAQVDEQVRASSAIAALIPVSDDERKLFRWVSVSAGICEEVAFRGFALWYAASYMPVWVAVLLTSLVFGMGHAYQGAGGAMRTGVLALVFGAMRVGSGSLLGPIVLHGTVDVTNGAMASTAIRSRERRQVHQLGARRVGPGAAQASTSRDP
jgi:hypothetical protein